MQGDSARIVGSGPGVAPHGASPDLWVAAARALAAADVCAVLGPAEDVWTTDGQDLATLFGPGTSQRATLTSALRRGTLILSDADDLRRVFGMGVPVDALIAVAAGRRPTDGIVLLAARRGGEQWLANAVPVAYRVADGWARRAAEAKVDALENRLAMHDRLLRRVLSIMSHDLRNPLFAIQLGVKVLERQSGMSDTITSLQRSVSLAATTLRRVVDAARAVLEIPVEPTPPEDEAAIAEICRMLLGRLAPTAGRVDLDLDEALRVRMGREIVERLVQPLLANALQHGTPNAPVRMSTSRDGRTVVLEIANEGNLPFSSVEKLEPFEFRSGDGLGVGLVLAQRLARTYGADLDVRQDGSTIRATLGMPLARS
jgi:signal transduction histidine kinase